VFKAIDLEGYDAILGWPWLQAANPEVDWIKWTWRYRRPRPYDLDIVMTAQECAIMIMDAWERPASSEILSQIYAVHVYETDKGAALLINSV
jgi:hypothetical protein